MASGEFDLIVAYYLTSYGLMAASIAPGRYIAVPAGSDIAPIRVKVPRLAAARIAVRRAMGTMAWTEPMADVLRRLGADPHKLLVLPRGIDLELFQKPVEAKQPSGIVRIVSTRRLRPLFRIDRLIGAMGQLRASRCSCSLEHRRRWDRAVQPRRPRAPERTRGPHHLRRGSRQASRREPSEEVRRLREPEPERRPRARRSWRRWHAGFSPSSATSRRIVRWSSTGGTVFSSTATTPTTSPRHSPRRRPTATSGNMPIRLNLALVRERFDIRRNTQVFLETAAPWRQTRAPR